MGITWKDTTTYSRTDTVREPRIWSATIGDMEFSVHRHIGCNDDWFITCYKLDINMRELQSKDIEDAKREAVFVIKKQTQKYVDKYMLTLSQIDTAIKEEKWEE